MCSLGPLWRAGSSGSVGNKVPCRIAIGNLRQHADAVFVIPALKLSQHLRGNLSLEGFRGGDECVLRDLQISEIEIKAP